MAITLFLPAVLSRLAEGQKKLELEGATVGDAIDAAASRYPQLAPRLKDEKGEPYPYVTIYLNDDDVRLKSGFATPLEDGDELTVVPAIAGG